jgi:hypothetical protein
VLAAQLDVTGVDTAIADTRDVRRNISSAMLLNKGWARAASASSSEAFVFAGAVPALHELLVALEVPVIYNIISRVGLAVGLMSSALFATACSGAPAAEQEERANGTLSLPLLATAGAHTFRLQGSMYVSGPLFAYLDLSGDSEMVSTPLPAGDYSAYLYSWALTRDDGFGNFAPVDARLISSSSPVFSIFNQTTSTLSFQFETDGQLVSVGSGSLHVDVDVRETPGVCTPLGGDCPAGSWCAPPELTGAPLRCIDEGSVQLGESCSSPSDCVRNASCFEFGAGARCAALCSSADFGQACSDGGTCTAQGVDYGVCSPSSP